MKRSEAVYKLAGYLSTMDGFADKHPEELVPVAEWAIDGLEKIGLLPQNPVAANWYGSWEKENKENQNEEKSSS